MPFRKNRDIISGKLFREVGSVICYLVRHGKDDETIRGGWSNHGLIPEGVEQVRKLGKEMQEQGLRIRKICSSDLQRAKETALLLQEYLKCPIVFAPDFREANNGHLAGMKHEAANAQFPGVYWSALEYTECYPGGESPAQFFQRIDTAWREFKSSLRENGDGNTLLVTHGGVLEVILCMEYGLPFTNQKKQFQTSAATLFPVEIK